MTRAAPPVSIVGDDEPLPTSPASRHAWRDAELVAAVRGEPPDEAALDALVRRHRGALYGWCRVLSADADAAQDLAQETWYRVLRARRALDPAHSFPAYLVTIARNLWRDRNRAALREGLLARERLLSLEAPAPAAGPDAPALADLLPDPAALPVDAQAQLAADVDRVLAMLGPRARDVLTSRYLEGESCAEIGRRYGRTEQAVSGWIREAIREVRDRLAAPRGRAP